MDYKYDEKIILGIQSIYELLIKMKNFLILNLNPKLYFIINYFYCDFMVQWLWRGENTRYHSELGRENPQRDGTLS